MESLILVTKDRIITKFQDLIETILLDFKIRKFKPATLTIKHKDFNRCSTTINLVIIQVKDYFCNINLNKIYI